MSDQLGIEQLARVQVISAILKLQPGERLSAYELVLLARYVETGEEPDLGGEDDQER